MVQQVEQVQIDVVGSSTFGLYPKISLAKTYNMFISDGWMVNYAGYRRINNVIDGKEGRGLFSSIRGGFLISVIDDKVYRVNKALGATQVGSLNTRFGDVYIDENLASQICIVDGNDAWIYNYSDSSFTQQTLNVGAFNLIPGYVTYHNSFFLIAPSIFDPNDTNDWYAFEYASDSTISLVTNSVFPLQTKPDKCLAVKRLPGKANHILVIGSSVCEVWTNVGGEENYRRNSSFNIDYGCVSKATIAANDEFLCFLGKNEANSVTLIVTDGSSVNKIATDGINNLLEGLSKPDKSMAFFFRQDGHLFYQITFYDDEDNISLIYDFTTKKFFHVTDDRMNYHPARSVAFFNDEVIFTSIQRGSLYEMSTEIDGAYEDVGSLSGKEIPRIRVTSSFKKPSSQPFVCPSFEFWVEQGQTSFSALNVDQEICVNQMVTEAFGEVMLTEDGEIMITEDGYCSTGIQRPRIDLSFSKNGGQSFSTIVGVYMNPQGHHRNRLQWHRIGRCNEIIMQIRFWGLNRFIANNGLLEIAS
jgi:hypothetical protein